MNESFQLIFPILLPIFSGLLIGFVRPMRKPRVRCMAFIVTLVLNTILVIQILVRPDSYLELFRLTDRLLILFRTDDLARLFCVLASAMFLFVGVYCPGYMKHHGNEGRFYMFYLIALGMLMGFGLSGNLMTLYLFLELLTFASIPLVLHSMKREAITAALKYLYYSIAGASLALIGFFFIHAYGTTLTFTPGGVLDMHKLAGREEQLLFVTLLTIIGFGAKAGMFPLHVWLPVAHPVAPAPASALLSGVITKIGIFAVIRFVYYLTGPAIIQGTWMQTAWISIALFTSVMGSLLAFREQELKRRLAYSTVSQIGYIMFGLAVLTVTSLAGALLHTVFHSIAKNALFLISGVIILGTHKTEVADMRGIGKKMPVTLVCFAVLAITLVGIPSTGGFISKWNLIAGSLGADTGFFSWLGPCLLLLCALLAAGYLLPIVINGFFGQACPDSGKEAGSGKLLSKLSMGLPILLLSAAALIFGIFSGSLVSLCERIAGGLL